MGSFRSKAPSSSFAVWHQFSTFASGPFEAVRFPDHDHQDLTDPSCSSAFVAAGVYHPHMSWSRNHFHPRQHRSMPNLQVYFVDSDDLAACSLGHRMESLWKRRNIAEDLYCKLNMGWGWVAMAPRCDVSERLRGCRSSRWRPYPPDAIFVLYPSLQTATFFLRGARNPLTVVLLCVPLQLTV